MKLTAENHQQFKIAVLTDFQKKINKIAFFSTRAEERYVFSNLNVDI